jgi:hypothetical protein
MLCADDGVMTTNAPDPRSIRYARLCKLAERCYDAADRWAGSGDADLADFFDARGHAFVWAADHAHQLGDGLVYAS